MRLLLIVLALPGGLVSGGATALFLLPPPAADIPHGADGIPPPTKIHDQVKTEFEYSRLTNQFVLPIIVEGRVRALIALSISLEIRKGAGERVFAREPKLRDAFLRVLFDHANSGRFDGEFTSGGNLAVLRSALLEAGRVVLEDTLNDVLITDIARQDN